MNIHFTKTKKLMLDEHYNLLYDGEVSNEKYKEICETLPLNENGKKGVIFSTMGSVSGDIITILKSITNEVEKTNRQEVYIYDKSTPEDFWYYCTIGKSEKNDDNYIINNTVNGKVREFMIKYRSYYTKIFNHTTSNIIENSNISIENCEKLSSLSSSLTILSKLNLNGKNVMIKEDQPEMNFYLKIKKDEPYTVIELEEKLINQLIDYINEKLKTKDNLCITFIISSITSITEKNDITMKLTSNFSVE